MRDAADFDGAAGRRVEPAHQVEQRRLARSRRPHQRQEIALRDVEVDAFQHVDALAAAREVLVDVTGRGPADVDSAHCDSLLFRYDLRCLDDEPPAAARPRRDRPRVRPAITSTRSPSVPPVLTARRSTTSSPRRRRRYDLAALGLDRGLRARA